MIVTGGASLKIEWKLNIKLQWNWGMSIVLNVELPLIEHELNNAQWAARGYYFNLTKLRAELVIKPAYAGG